MRSPDLGFYLPALASVVFAVLCFWGFGRLQGSIRPMPIPQHMYDLVESWRSGAEPLPAADAVAAQVGGLLKLVERCDSTLQSAKQPLLLLGIVFALITVCEIRNLVHLRRHASPAATTRGR